MFLLWYFILYSFLGFLLEIAFARVIDHPKKDRKCLLLLPLCPVYGLGAMAIHFLAGLRPGVLWVMVSGFVGATAAEFAVGSFCRHVLRVEFWDYSRMRWNVGGLVCLQFSLCWTVLALALVYGADPLLIPLIRSIPAWLGPPAAILLAADTAVSAVALRRTGTTRVLQWYR